MAALGPKLTQLDYETHASKKKCGAEPDVRPAGTASPSGKSI